MTQEIQVRRYDIDWLRSLAFIVLILYHIGMYYVLDWGWHIKSVEQSAWLQNVMMLTNPWRMSLLFFISGIALSLVIKSKKISSFTLLTLRSYRLLIPLMFSMIVIVPPQLYFELKQFYSYDGGYSSFMYEYLNIDTALVPQKQSAIGLLTWNHLWFLPYLWCYSLCIVVLQPILLRASHWLSEHKIKPYIACLVLLLVSSGIWLGLAKAYPTTHALVDDWYNHARYLWVFITGFMLPHISHLWQKLIDNRRLFMILAVLSYIWLLMDTHGMLNVGETLDKLWVIKFAHAMLLNINHWAWILAMVGYAGRYLNFSNPYISKANKAILPCYILHQTVIILIAVYLSRWQIPAWIEAPLLLVLTTGGCWLGYHIIHRSRILRPLFGLG